MRALPELLEQMDLDVCQLRILGRSIFINHHVVGEFNDRRDVLVPT